MLKKKVATALAMAAVTLPIVAACSTTPAVRSNSGAARTAVTKLTWSTWGNPGELSRFYKLTDAYNKTHPNVHWTLVPIPNTGYLQKLQTELAGGSGPDVYYMGDGDMSTYVKDNVLLDLTPYLGTGSIKHSITDWPAGVWGGAKVGNDVYGIAPDCNPLVMYFNKTVLKQAGIKEDPITLYKQGRWTWTEFQKLTAQVKAHGKYGFIQDDWWAPIDSWLYVNGAQPYDSKGNFIGNKNPKALAAYHYINNNIKNGNFIFTGTLPKGQGDDAMFMSNQAAFVTAGRWYAPEFNADKSLNYDVVPYPSQTGKLMPTGIALAYVGINKTTKFPKEAWDFLDYFTSTPGVTFRLSNGGNAIPALAHGPDQVALEGKPAHQSYILQERQIGFPVPYEEISHPGIQATLTKDIDLAFLQKVTIDVALSKIAADIQKVNSGH
jgi:multiple sugar transport system substrate-binding protein